MEWKKWRKDAPLIVGFTDILLLFCLAYLKMDFGRELLSNLIK